MVQFADPPAYENLVELLSLRADQQRHQRGFTFLTDEQAEEGVTYGELDRQARTIGAHLQRLKAAGERVLLLYPPGLAYIAAFFGCLYAGAVAVPVYPPRRNRPTPRLEVVVADSQAKIVLTTAKTLAEAARLQLHAPYLKELHWLATDDLLADAAAEWQPIRVDRDHHAFLQYTSGSTATPKGVILTHGNLLHNLEGIRRAFEHSAESQGVIWLPPYHDMGLIGGILQPLYVGFPVVLMSPMAFLQRPYNWLHAVSRYRATTSGGPNFAYDLCVQKITPEQRLTLDLSHWRIAFNGAETVRHETLERFATTFAPCGFQREMFYPCYGLAEGTLLVAGGERAAVPLIHLVDERALGRHRVATAACEGHGVRALVSSGRTLTDQTIVVADPASHAHCASDKIGELWVSGPSVAQGYWNQPTATAQSFGAFLADSGEGPFLRTGDLGFLRDGELFVTGRLKDLIIVRGHNYYPQDIELTVEGSHGALQPGSGAAFSVEVNGEEQLVVAQEIKMEARHRVDGPEIASAIRQAVSEHHELQIYAVLLLKSGTIPKTSSGKIQRHACRDGWHHNSLSVVACSLQDRTHESPHDIPNGESSLRPASFAATDPADRHAVLMASLREQVARVLKVPVAQVDSQQPLNRLGMDSLLAVELTHEIETTWGVAVPMVELLEGITVAQLVVHLLHALQASPREHSPVRRAAPNERVPLAFSQQRLWFLERLAPGSAAYHIPVVMRLRGHLDVSALERSLNEIVRRHEALRTTFHTESGRPFQTIIAPYPLAIPITDLGGLSPAAWQEAVRQRAMEEARRPFDLTRGPLLRTQLLRWHPDEHVLFLTMHHIISDGWSMGILLREVATLYAAFVQGKPSPLPELPLQYADFVQWQRQRLETPEVIEPLRVYWEQQLTTAPPVLPLRTDRERPRLQTFRGAQHSFALAPMLRQALQALALAHDATLFMTLLAALKVLLRYDTGRDDMVVGTTIANRTGRDTQYVIGLFVNQLVLRTNLAGATTFEDVLRRVRATTLEAYKQQELPFDKVVEGLRVERNPSYNPLFQVSFVFENAPIPALSLAGLTLDLIEVDSGAAPFDLSVLLSEAGQGLKGLFRYNVDLFDGDTIRHLADQYQTVLVAVAAHPTATLDAVQAILAEADQRQWAKTASALGDARLRKFEEIKPRR